MADETQQKNRLAPTGKLIVLTLGVIALACIASVVALAMTGVEIPGEMTAIASTAVGAIAGLALSGQRGD